LLGNILFLNREVSTYNAPTTSCSHVLDYYRVEVTILAFLRESNTGRVSANNTSIKLEIIVSYKAFTLLGQEISLLELQILYLSEVVISHEQSVISLKANNTKGIIAIEQARVIS
jgi:hypothetical protein